MRSAPARSAARSRRACTVSPPRAANTVAPPAPGSNQTPDPGTGSTTSSAASPVPEGSSRIRGPRVRLDLARGLRAPRDAPVDADLRGEGGDRVQQPRPGRGGQLQAPLGNDRPQPPVAGREPDHLAPPAVHEAHVVALRVPVVGNEACAKAPCVLVDHELGLPAHHLHRSAVLAEDVRMTGELEQTRLVQVVLRTVAPVTPFPDLRGRGAVLVQQEIHRRGRSREPLHRDRLAGRPGAVPVLLLLARLGRELAEVLVNGPREPAPAGGRAALLRRRRLAPGLECERLERLQGILPLRHRREQGGQRPRAETRMQRGRFVAACRRGPGASLRHLQLGLAEDRQALRQGPVEAGAPRALLCSRPARGTRPLRCTA